LRPSVTSSLANANPIFCEPATVRTSFLRSPRRPEELRITLLAAAGDAEARLGTANPYGQRYIVDFDVVRQNKTVRIRSAWIVREDLPRLTSCYVL
jgi:hypothetical protein